MSWTRADVREAVDALKGSTRNGNVIEASFYDSDKFGNGIYE